VIVPSAAAGRLALTGDAKVGALRDRLPAGE
jgi:hypothetical protein